MGGSLAEILIGRSVTRWLRLRLREPFEVSVTRITATSERVFHSPRLSCMGGNDPSRNKWETQITERDNRVNEELLDAELDLVCAGVAGGCHTPIKIDPKTHLPTSSTTKVGGPLN